MQAISFRRVSNNNNNNSNIFVSRLGYQELVVLSLQFAPRLLAKLESLPKVIRERLLKLRIGLLAGVMLPQSAGMHQL